jgi:hypothetical protein
VLACAQQAVSFRSMVAFAPSEKSHSWTISKQLMAFMGVDHDVNTDIHRGLSRPSYDSHRGECYVDEALAMIVGTAKYYYHANHLYSVAALTNQTGNVVER